MHVVTSVVYNFVSAQGRADGGFHSLQLSVDCKHSFDFSDEPVKAGDEGKYDMNNVHSPADGASKTFVGGEEGLAYDQNLQHGGAIKAGGLSIYSSESWIFTPTSNLNASSSVNYSADGYARGVDLSTNADIGMSVEVAAGARAAGNAQVRALGSYTSGFRANAPFFSSLGSLDHASSANNEHARTPSFKPTPIKIPSHRFLSSDSSAGSPLHMHKDNGNQAHTCGYGGNHRSMQMPVEANDTIAVQVQSLDLSFVHLFTESKQEILKLLRDDKFPRFKLTHEFQQFIYAIKPYESNVMSGEYVTSFQNLDNSLSAQSIA